MLKRLVKRLRNVILLKHLLKLNSDAIWKDEIVACRMEQLTIQYEGTQKCKELDADYSRLYGLIYNTDDKEQRYHELFELDDLITQMMDEVQTFHYLAGVNDAMQIFDIS